LPSRPRRDGVLILSSTAGAAQELTDALIVNPKKQESMVDALYKAVKMPKRELRERVTNMARPHLNPHRPVVGQNIYGTRCKNHYPAQRRAPPAV